MGKQMLTQQDYIEYKKDQALRRIWIATTALAIFLMFCAAWQLGAWAAAFFLMP